MCFFYFFVFLKLGVYYNYCWLGGNYDVIVIVCLWVLIRVEWGLMVCKKIMEIIVDFFK